MTIKTSVPLSVSQLNNQANYILEENFSDIIVVGEISSLKSYPSGYTYITIKDNLSELSCIAFPSIKKTEILKVGLEANFRGKLSIYPVRGKLQFIISSFEDKQDGAIWKEYLDLKNKLHSEGLFDDRYKKNIPKYPFNIGIVSSSEGAVIHDMTNIFKERASHINLYLKPCKIQGVGSVQDMIEAISIFNSYDYIDLIIVARGGGSFEDLNSFNDERLVRSIYASKVPVVTAIGHETDFTISDFASDYRASTPSVAAQSITEPSYNIRSDIKTYKSSIKHSLEKRIEFLHNENKHLKSHLSIDYISEIVNKIINDKNNLDKILDMNIKNKLTYLSKLLYQYKKRLDSNNISNILKKGFSLVLDKNGELVSNSKTLKLRDLIDIKFSDGKVGAKIIEK